MNRFILLAFALTAATACQLAPNRGNLGIECDDAGDCDDPELGCVPVNDLNPAGQKVCMPPPGDWSCQGKFFGDGACDCGCDFLDSDCLGNTSSGACAQDGNQCPNDKEPKPDDNTTCQ